jgi:hypothetical protein
MTRRLSTLALALSLMLGAPLPASPSARTGAPRAPRRTETGAATDWLSHFWKRLTALWSAEGCAADPNGAKCSAKAAGGQAVVVQPSEGCGIDPNGCR